MAINTLAQKSNGIEEKYLRRAGNTQLQTEYSDRETEEIMQLAKWPGEIEKALGGDDSTKDKVDAQYFRELFNEFSAANFSPAGAEKLKQRAAELNAKFDAFTRRGVSDYLSMITAFVELAESSAQHRREPK